MLGAGTLPAASPVTYAATPAALIREANQAGCPKTCRLDCCEPCPLRVETTEAVSPDSLAAENQPAGSDAE